MQSDDARTAERALERYGNTIYRLAASYLKNLTEAEDIVQEVILLLLDKTPAFESDEHEKAWLLRVTANLCKNRLKSSWWKKRSELTDTIPADVSPDSEDGEVLRVVGTLPPKYRAVIYLYYYEGYSTADVAKLTAAKETTVRSRLARAREALKKQLKGGGEFEEFL